MSTFRHETPHPDAVEYLRWFGIHPLAGRHCHRLRRQLPPSLIDATGRTVTPKGAH
jgi:hypothetical protein